MKKLLVLLAFLLLSTHAQAQTTSQETLPGYLSTNCAGLNNPCYLPYGPITAVKSAAAEGSHVLKASAGSLMDLTVTSGASAGFVLIYNRTTAPGDGAVTPVSCVQLPANQTVGLAFTPTPLLFSTGITVVFSTTGCFTQTTSTTAFFSGLVQ